MAKAKRKKTTAETTGSPGARAAHLRSGAGKHGDRRTKRCRTRATQQAAALNGW